MAAFEEWVVPFKDENQDYGKGRWPLQDRAQSERQCLQGRASRWHEHLHTFNVRVLTPYIEDKDEDIGDLRANPLRGGEVDVEQIMKPNLLINIKAWIRFGPLVTYEGGTQVLGSPKSLLVWKPWEAPK